MFSVGENSDEAIAGIAGLAPLSLIAHEVRSGALREPAAERTLTDIASRGFIVFAKSRVFGPQDVVRRATAWVRGQGNRLLLSILAPGIAQSSAQAT